MEVMKFRKTLQKKFDQYDEQVQELRKQAVKLPSSDPRRKELGRQIEMKVVAMNELVYVLHTIIE